MDEVKVEKTPAATHTTINRTTAPTSGSGMLWFIVGGLVVAIVVVGYFVMGQGLPSSGAAAPAAGDVSVTIDSAPAADAPAASDAAPEAAPVAPAE